MHFTTNASVLRGKIEEYALADPRFKRYSTETMELCGSEGIGSPWAQGPMVPPMVPLGGALGPMGMPLGPMGMPLGQMGPTGPGMGPSGGWGPTRGFGGATT